MIRRWQRRRLSRFLLRYVPMIWLVLCAQPLAAASETAAWDALRAGGHVALVRHASAPGTGDPPGFRLDDCATQRNLSAAGRDEARRLGDRLRGEGVRVDAVYSSEWCRCLETARLLELAPAVPMPALNSFFARPAAAGDQTAALRAWIGANIPVGTVVMVTHQVVMTALTDVFPRSGETIVVRPLAGGGLQVVGRIPPP